jgi:hypothetical protein
VRADYIFIVTKRGTNMKRRGARALAGVLTTAYAIMALSLLAGEAFGAGGHDFKVCEGQFALCAASTCQATGGSITVNVTSGGTASFPEYNCTCPILSGPAIADLTGGNMQGSCEPPADQIWSLYEPRAHIPQAITNWSRKPALSSAPPLICPASLNLGNQLVNCFSFACDPAGEINGVPVATCHCPLGESLEGVSVPANTAFGTQAGQGNDAICADHPVAGPIPSFSPPNDDNDDHDDNEKRHRR